MAENEFGLAPNANVVEGYSNRFNLLMDRAGVPKQNRLTIGSKRFGVVVNTFKSWCNSDRPPGTYADQLSVVENLLKDIPGTYNAKAVNAWLIAGEAVPNPLEEDAGALTLVELGLRIAQLAQAKKLDFQSLPRDVRFLIIRRARDRLSESAPTEDTHTLDRATEAMVVGMLETAHAALRTRTTETR